MLQCDPNIKNLGKSNCRKIFQVLSSMILLPDSFSFDATQDDTAKLAVFNAAFLADPSVRAYLIAREDVFNFEPVPEDDVREQSAIGKEISVRDGQLRFNAFLSAGLEYHKAVHSHAGRTGRIILLDQNDVMIGTSILQDGTDTQGLTINLFDPGNIMFSDGSTGTKPTFYVSFDDPKEVNIQGFTTDLSGVVPGFIVATTVQIAVITAAPSASNIQVRITGLFDGQNILGLDTPDFVLTTTAGADQTGAISAVIDNADGTYDINGTGFVAGNVDLVVAASMSVPGWENEKPVDFTVA